jgi:hypothetical protein
MEHNFKVGDKVSLLFFDLAGTIVSISSPPKSLLDFVGMEESEDFLLYKVEVNDGCFVTTSVEGLEPIKPQRVSE